MNTGKTIKLDPRSAPDKAPEVAPAVTEKQMPEYPLDRNELIYPGQGSPFPVSDPAEEAGSRGPLVPAPRKEPPTEMPRSKVHLSTLERTSLLPLLRDCRDHCEQCIRACEQAVEPHKLSACITICRATADLCRLLESYVTAQGKAQLAPLATDLAMVCARACESSAVECGKHPQMEEAVACEKSCRSAAEACRSFAG